LALMEGGENDANSSSQENILLPKCTADMQKMKWKTTCQQRGRHSSIAYVESINGGEEMLLPARRRELLLPPLPLLFLFFRS
jgi:hypothetical protein